MNAHIIRLLLYLSFMLAAGCSSPDPSGTNSPGNVSTGNAVIFNPTTGDIPLPNVLATAKNTDPLAGRAANTPMTPPDALAYVNKYEVGSTNAVAGVNAPIYIRFSNPVDAATVTPSNIKVFQLTPDSAGTESSPLGFTDISALFEFRYTAGSTDLFLFPTFPLSPATRYLYVVTGKVLDAASGKPVISSSYFDLLKSKFELVGPFAALEAVRDNVYADTARTIIKFSGYAKVMDDMIAKSADTKITSRNDIALLGRFITTAAGFVSKDAIGTMMPVESALRAFAAGSASGGMTGKSWTNGAAVTTTFDRGGGNPSPDAFWTGAMGGVATAAPATVNSVVTGTISSAQLSIDPVVAKANSLSMDLTGITSGGFPAYNPAAGVLQPFRDGTGALTGYYHTAAAVPFVLVSPTVPTGKVIIFQHGVTGQKEQVIAVAGSLTAAGYTVVAIDLALHGGLAVPTHTTGAAWGQDFMAVGAPLATRSNIQQSAFNLHRLELTIRTGGFAGLGIIPPAPPAGVDIKYVSISLGSIVGAYYLAGNTSLNSAASLPLPYNQTTLNTDMKGFLSVPGGRLAYLLQSSPTFSPGINDGLTAVGITTGTPTYNNFFQVTQSIVDTVDPATMTTPLASTLPSRLSGRIVMQEAVGDLVIPNDSTRYFGNALGGREVLGAAAATVAPGFKQVGYRGASAARIPSSFMYTLAAGTPVAKVDFAAAQNDLAAATPAEGYFQFDQEKINHGFLIDPRASATNTTYAQTQMVNFLLRGVIVDPTPTGVAKQTSATRVPALKYDVRMPPVLKILGY